MAMRTYLSPGTLAYNPIRLEVFKHLFSAIPEEMGAVLRKGSYSPNIKERRDYSCALFNEHGDMIAQAAHIPVHLGSMPLSVISAIQAFPDKLTPGDIVILNHPFLGGTHLPDITLVAPVYKSNRLIGYVANRAHHADVGGISPGSMPIANELLQEGLIIPPVKLALEGKINQGVYDMILANVRTPHERSGDLMAQIAAIQRGVLRLQEMVEHYGLEEVQDYMIKLLAYSERLVRERLKQIPEGIYTFSDMLDNDGVSTDPIPIQVTIYISGDNAIVNFSGSALQQAGSINAVYAITLSAVYYVFRCLLQFDAPNNSGCLAPITVIAPEGSVINANYPAPVAGGNVETSQRIVDVLLGAFAKAIPDMIPAASQGTMNNLIIGGWDTRKNQPFAYYETIGGGSGARPNADGPSAQHSHMTNTLNTPIEALEYAYPLRVVRYEIRKESGGKGKYIGGDGIQRDIQVMCDAQITVLSDRRNFPPYGTQGGLPGKTGENWVISNGRAKRLPSKGSIRLKAGDVISILTPGGGGYGKP